MPTGFQQVNQVQQGGAPQFAEVPVVQGTGSEGVVQALNVGAGIFQQAARHQQAKAVDEAKRTTATAMGDLSQRLLNIRQAGATSGKVDVSREQRLALSKFNAEHPELATDASRLFKEATGET